MKILVTGSEGFLGKHLVKILQSDGHEVIGWDIVNGHDVNEPIEVADIPVVEAIFHLACPVDPGNYEQVAIDTIETSSRGTLNMLGLAKYLKAKFLYVSSSEVYGDNELPFIETDQILVEPNCDRSYYGVSKLFGEVATLNYHRYKGVDVRIVRPFNIYGPGMSDKDSRVIPSFMRKMKGKDPFVIYGMGLHKRSFCYIDDFIEGMVRAMFKDNTNGEIFNIGTTDVITIVELASLMDEHKLIDFKPARSGEQRERLPDISKAKKYLQWEPKTTLQRGLELMWESYQ